MSNIDKHIEAAARDLGLRMAWWLKGVMDAMSEDANGARPASKAGVEGSTPSAHAKVLCQEDVLASYNGSMLGFHPGDAGSIPVARTNHIHCFEELNPHRCISCCTCGVSAGFV